MDESTVSCSTKVLFLAFSDLHLARLSVVCPVRTSYLTRKKAYKMA